MRKLLVAILILWSTAALAQTDTPTSSPTRTPTQTLTSTPTATPSRTPTVTPTATPTYGKTPRCTFHKSSITAMLPISWTYDAINDPNSTKLVEPEGLSGQGTTIIDTVYCQADGATTCALACDSTEIWSYKLAAGEAVTAGPGLELCCQGGTDVMALQSGAAAGTIGIKWYRLAE